VKRTTTILLLAGGALSLVLSARMCTSREDAVERVAVVEHQQWMEWSKKIAPEVSPETRKRWEKYWVPYEQLPEEVKEQDRIWARRALDAASGD
jgi:hypothetical protein